MMILDSMSADLSLPSASGGPEIGRYHGIEAGYLVSSAQGIPVTSYARQSMSHSYTQPAPEEIAEETGFSRDRDIRVRRGVSAGS